MPEVPGEKSASSTSLAIPSYRRLMAERSPHFAGIALARDLSNLDNVVCAHMTHGRRQTHDSPHWAAHLFILLRERDSLTEKDLAQLKVKLLSTFKDVAFDFTTIH